jgi:hypothetical protein
MNGRILGSGIIECPLHPPAIFAEGWMSEASGVRVLGNTVRDSFENRLVERRDIVRLAAEDELTVGNDCLVHPVAAGILDVSLERWP